jgi:phage shock protein A
MKQIDLSKPVDAEAYNSGKSAKMDADGYKVNPEVDETREEVKALLARIAALEENIVEWSRQYQCIRDVEASLRTRIAELEAEVERLKGEKAQLAESKWTKMEASADTPVTAKRNKNL